MSRQERNDYLALCQDQPTVWLRQCLAEPSPYMAPRHCRLLRLVLKLRKRGRIAGMVA